MTKNSQLAIVHDDVTFTLGALGAKDVIAAASKIDASRARGFRVMRTEYAFGIESKTAGEGPILLGLGPAMAAAEIEETLEADPQSPDDRTAEEQTSRPVFPLCLIPRSQTNSGTDQPMFMHVAKLKWSIPQAEDLNWFAYNMDTGALTTGTVIRIYAKHFGVWLRD